MKVTTCDTCHDQIAGDALEYQLSRRDPKPVLDDDEIEMIAELRLGDESDWQFCSAGCLATWAMGNDFDEKPRPGN